MFLSEIELEIMELSRSRETGGIDLFWQFWSAPIGGLEKDARTDLIGIASDKFPSPLLQGQFVPVQPLPWASDIVFDGHSDIIMIGAIGCGKTLNMVLVAGYLCCMLPNFRYLGTAPKSWQADLSYREFLQFAIDWDNNLGAERRITKWIKNVRMRPQPMIEFVNGSTMEFKSIDRDASGIMTWSGDMAVVDQAEDQSIDLETVMGNLGTRLRGQIGGRARLGKMVLMANSAYNPVLWETYDDYEADPERLALLLTSYDNPYLTEKSLRDIKRRFRDKDEAQRLMHSVRPLPKGKEFTQNLIVMSQSDGLDAIMNDALAAGMPGYFLESATNTGAVTWSLPAQRGHLYILAGDPGQGNPPYRNSGVVMVFDVTDFPKQPATLASFKWVYGYGSYWPFLNAMEAAYTEYNPYYAGFDATGTQKAFDDLAVLNQDRLWSPINMSGLKMHMVLCLKVLMGRGFVQIPKSLYSVWNQLLMWHMPDKQLRQDIASCLFIIGYILNQTLPLVEGETTDLDEGEVREVSRLSRGRIINNRRSSLRSIQ